MVNSDNLTAEKWHRHPKQQLKVCLIEIVAKIYVIANV